MKGMRLNKENLMQIAVYLVIAAVIFKNISWLPKCAGILLVVASALAIIEARKEKTPLAQYMKYILLILAGIYLIIEQYIGMQ